MSELSKKKKWWEWLSKDKRKPVLIEGAPPFWRTVLLDQIDCKTGLLKCDGVPWCPLCNQTLEEVKQLTERLKYEPSNPKC